eukprot:CAMPEP_0198474632 /NCGR_PEP_ID=MMETSP1456-20131121/40411_1 /TAXON_ID=1461544 ORGANISM="Unidentified sp., Strain RCC1871" /NCGR_SAMPLE_ID=MMETSP1456 /ASSEMBLY_ACC=CAM_ASM_001119 /LENGTH=252 /DNA_ID=CAMNT_0044201329 /DNA_START=475 /DNA_END=1230 /DNA_ORIENTATION=-
MRPSSSRVWLLLPDASALIPPRQTHRLVGKHPESVVARTKAVEGRPDVQVHRHGLRSGGRGVVEVYHVPHLLSTPVYGPVVPVKGKLVAKPVQEPSPWAEVLRPPLELGQRRPAAHVLVELLPLKDVLPDSLVHRIVDGDHDVHVLLPRLPTLPLHRVVEICGEGYAQFAASFSWWFGRSVGPMGMDETCLVLDRDAPDLSALSLWIFGMLFADAGGLPTRGRSGGGADVEHSWSPHSPLRMFPALTKSCAA